LISHYATRGRRLPLLAVLEEATSESSYPCSSVYSHSH